MSLTAFWSVTSQQYLASVYLRLRFGKQSMADTSAQKRQAVGKSNATKTALPRQGSTLRRRIASAHLLEAAVQIRQLLLECGRPAGIK